MKTGEPTVPNGPVGSHFVRSCELLMREYDPSADEEHANMREAATVAEVANENDALHRLPVLLLEIQTRLCLSRGVGLNRHPRGTSLRYNGDCLKVGKQRFVLVLRIGV